VGGGGWWGVGLERGRVVVQLVLRGGLGFLGCLCCGGGVNRGVLLVVGVTSCGGGVGCVLAGWGDVFSRAGGGGALSWLVAWEWWSWFVDYFLDMFLWFRVVSERAPLLPWKMILNARSIVMTSYTPLGT